MPFTAGHVPAHKGRITTTQPFTPDAVAKLKHHLRDDPRGLAILSLGINSALRVGDICNLKVDDLTDLPDGRTEVVIRERKTKKLRRLVLNAPTAQTLRTYLASKRYKNLHVFEGTRGPLTVGFVERLIKEWTKAVGLEGRYSGHSTRKTFARSRYEQGVSLATLMTALNHSSERITLGYIAVLPEEVESAYRIET